MRGVTIIILILLVSGCVRFREAEVEFVSREQLNAREAEAQCKALARNLLQIARCERR